MGGSTTRHQPPWRESRCVDKARPCSEDSPQPLKGSAPAKNATRSARRRRGVRMRGRRCLGRGDMNAGNREEGRGKRWRRGAILWADEGPCLHRVVYRAFCLVSLPPAQNAETTTQQRHLLASFKRRCQPRCPRALVAVCRQQGKCLLHCRLVYSVPSYSYTVPHTSRHVTSAWRREDDPRARAVPADRKCAMTLAARLPSGHLLVLVLVLL